MPGQPAEVSARQQPLPRVGCSNTDPRARGPHSEARMARFLSHGPQGQSPVLCYSSLRFSSNFSYNSPGISSSFTQLPFPYSIKVCLKTLKEIKKFSDFVTTQQQSLPLSPPPYPSLAQAVTAAMNFVLQIHALPSTRSLQAAAAFPLLKTSV